MSEQLRMIMAGLWHFTTAGVLVKVIELCRYPIVIVLGIVGIGTKLYFLFVATVLFHGTYDAIWKLGEANYFLYVLLGGLILVPNQCAVSNMVYRLQYNLYSGRLATAWTLGYPKSVLLINDACVLAAIKCLVVFLLIVLVAVYSKFSIGLFEYGVIAIALATSVATYLFFGLAAATVLLVLRRGDFLVPILTWGSTYLTGVFVPINALPSWTRPLAQLIPVTHCLTITRNILLGTATIDLVARAFIMLGILLIISFALALATYKFSIKNVETSGALIRF